MKPLFKRFFTRFLGKSLLFSTILVSIFLVNTNNAFATGCGTLTDVDGNTYTTVMIGTQCWMADNLRTTRTPGGTSLTEGSGMYSSGPSGSGSPWGRLYDWTTAMNGAPAATAVGAKIQGICPTGWHIPSDYNQDPNDDWQTLSNFLGGNSVSGGKMKRTEVSLYWNQTTGGPYGDNSSGFSGVAAGFWQYGMYHNTGYYAFFLSSSEYSATYHTIQSKVLFGNGTAFTGSNNNPETIGDSVRCIKDGAIFSYTVSTTAGTGGTISPASQTVTSGNTTTFTVTPNAGYTASVSGCSGSLSGTTYTTGAITGACTVSATFTPPASCTVTTKSNCSLPATASGSSAGNCSSGYSGSCNYLCTNGAWNQNSNLCTPSTCTLPWGNVIASGVSVPAFQALSVISPATCASKTLTCNNGGNLSGGNYQYSNCTVLQPSATISANPTRVRSTPPGNTSTIKWTLSNTSCTAKRNGVPWTPGPGFSSSNSYLDTITGQTVYIITCTGVTPQSVTVNVLAGFNEF